MINKTRDVAPSVANRGFAIRWPHSDADTARMNPRQLESQTGIFNANVADEVQKRVKRVDDAHARDLLTTTDNGLPVIGPCSGDAMSVLAMAHNHAMAILDAKIAELESKLAQLAATK
jgi:hypothetical protein